MPQRVYCNEICLKETADELGLSVNTVRKIVACQSEYVKTVMESGTFDSVRLSYLGSFIAKVKEVQMINHLKGLTEDQSREFRRAVRTGKIKFNWWENRDKNGNKQRKNKEVNSGDGA